MKYQKTKYRNIYTYETTKGKFYHVRRSYYINGDKKEATKSRLKTVAEARSVLAEIERKIENNEFTYNKNLTVDQYWNIYSENRLNTGRWSPDTEINKYSIYNTHFKKWLGNTKMKNISRIDYENSLNKLLSQFSRNTVKQTHSVLNAMLNDAVRNKFLDDNPIDGIYIGQSDVEISQKRISLEEFKIWDRCAEDLLDSYYYTFVRLTYLGLRKSEDYGIKTASCVRLENGRYRIKLDDSRTKGRPDGGRMKTKGSERYLVADEKTSRLLDYAIPKSHAIAKKYGRILGPDDYLFLSDYKNCQKKLLGKPLPTSRINTMFKQISKECGIYVTPHMMRHFFATQGQIAGVPIEHMAAALGHSTSYMTQKYTHIEDEVASSVTDSFMRVIN
ncbi:tyrosine-type recombinase/integrase [Streptococcus pluranimalium]|uniref:Tyrosine recombinase XerC n=1 Tax=Streptococcus pluranimalium TaxID=82348 RepID=A0A345VIB1_9STRE|nr:site-specific integrase [Streptococcus pluranimalium]AXJ12463.1 Tyrosine recombinase XerC [Streptococcus pluranimalium]